MSKRSFRGGIPLGLLAAFVAGVLIDGRLRTHGPPKPVQEMSDAFIAAPSAASTQVRLKPDAAPERSATPERSVVSGFGRTATTPAPAVSGFSADEALAKSVSRTTLRVPIDGVDMASYKGGFSERRDGGGRPHEAVDMLAPRNTPVHAVGGGTIAKLFTSKAGGLTIYEFDQDGHLCYYYAHLDHYADGLKDGQSVSQGDVIGYVGTTGNAPANSPHLHFAVFELNADKRWWQGRPLDPYLVFKKGLGSGD